MPPAAHDATAAPATPVLIVGDQGMLAAAVRRSLVRRGVRAIGVDRAQCDVTDVAQVEATFARTSPATVINCCAYTAVDKAEVDEAAATAVNGTAVGTLADACKRHKATLVHYSTDFVFAGDATEPYREDDTAAPVSAYGRSKLAGEHALRDSGLEEHLILRTAWLYGPWGGRPFPKIMLDAAKAGKPLTVINDQHGTPTLTIDLAEATLDLLAAGQRGTFHVTGGGRTTWFGFAKASLEAFGVKPVSLDPIQASDWATMRPDAASRPAFSVLDLSKTEAALGRSMRDWQRGLLDYRDLSAGDA